MVVEGRKWRPGTSCLPARGVFTEEASEVGDEIRGLKTNGGDTAEELDVSSRRRGKLARIGADRASFQALKGLICAMAPRPFVCFPFLGRLASNPALHRF